MDSTLITSNMLKKLKLYESLLLKWQKTINLVSPNTINDAWIRHFEDSLQLLPLIPSDTKTIYDLGAGAGFSGMVLAIARPDIAVTLIESDSKKCAFLQTVSRETQTPVTIENNRIEQIASRLLPPDIVTARALASLSDLLNFIHPWVKNNSEIRAIFPKGERWEDEINAAKSKGWTFHVKQTTSQTDKKAMILVLTNIRIH